MSHSVVSPAGALTGMSQSLAPARLAFVADPVPESGESFFNALDGREVTVHGNHWKIRVFSVLELAGRRYLQLALQGPGQYMLTLRMARDAESRQVVPALLPWLARPTSSGEILDLTAR